MNKVINYFWTQVSIAACLLTCCYFSYWLAGFTSPFIQFNTSLLGIIIGVVSILFLPSLSNKTAIFIVSGITIALIYYLQSRSGLLAWLAGGFVLFLSTKQFTLRKTKLLVFGLGIAAIAFVFVSITFFLKTNSTSGRWFIWQNCFTVLKSNWFTGVGWGRFRVAYNEQQASWFQQHGFHNKQALLADTVYYAFNEWLQLAIEIGLPLTTVLFLLLISIWIKAFKNVNKTKSSYTNKKAMAAFAALIFSSFFSYPFYYLPTLFLFIVLFIWVVAIGQFDFITRQKILFKSLLILFASLVAIYCSFQLYARMQLKKAAELNLVGYKKLALQKMQSAYPILKRNGDFLYTMGNSFYSLNKMDSALYYFQQSAKTKNDCELHKKLGQLYFETGNQPLAEAHFLKAVYMVPNRFKSRELLVEFYIQTGNKPKAKYWASQTLLMPEKIPSAQVLAIKQRMKKFIDDNVW